MNTLIPFSHYTSRDLQQAFAVLYQYSNNRFAADLVKQIQIELDGRLDPVTEMTKPADTTATTERET